MTAPAGLNAGDELDVVLLTEDREKNVARRQPILDILDSLPGDIGHFKSAQDVDKYVRGERDSWEL